MFVNQSVYEKKDRRLPEGASADNRYNLLIPFAAESAWLRELALIKGNTLKSAGKNG
jgi:hypothetical protein